MPLKVTNQSWALTILVIWNKPPLRKQTIRLLFVALAIAQFSSTSALSTRRKKSTTKTAQSKPAPTAKNVGAAGLIAVAERELEAGHLDAAAEYAHNAGQKAPSLDDYAQYIRAQAEYRLKNYTQTAQSATRIFNQPLLSPLVGPAAVIVVQAELDGDNPKHALELIRKYYDRIPQPQADLLLARCFRGVGDFAQSAEYYQRVYYNYPTAKEATDAANALVDLKQRLAEAFPVPMATTLLARAQKLFDGHNPAAARIELTAAIPQIGGAQRDLARVRLGVADLLSNHAEAASQYLTALKVDDPEADAERLNYLIRCVRKQERHGDVQSLLDQLAKLHPTSTWRLDSLISVADQARTDNLPSVYLPLYQACATTFPSEARAAWCHYRVAYESYKHDGQDAPDLLRAQLQQYPGSDDTTNAIYFLGRLTERKNNIASARACYEQLTARFPNTYFGVLARERLKQPTVEAATSDPATLEFFRAIPWPPRPQFPTFVPDPTTQSRIDRAKLLALTGLNDWAEGELKFGARNDNKNQTHVYAYELAKLALTRDAPDQSLRYIKAYAPGYLYVGLDQAPVPFWRLAFPIPYRPAIEEDSRLQSVDPFLVAALIRQESEFNVRVISYANAYGLMQIVPATGRELARRLKVRGFTPAQLLTSDRNLQLGTFYFHNLLGSFGGQPEMALAAYNAGQGRVGTWQTWGPFREPPEFIEAIPFHQTREYVQVVMRNADVYRRLYAGTVPDLPVYKPKPPAPASKKSKFKPKSRKRPR